MVSVNNLSLEFSARPLFSNISFMINQSDKIALVGKNGAGKSTILKILNSEILPTSGSISKPHGIKIGYLPQQMKLADETTLFHEVKKTFNSQYSAENRLYELNEKLSSISNFENNEYNSLFDEITELNHLLEMNPLQNIQGEIEKTLTGLGFNRTDFDRPTSEFSGGWRMRIELAKILLKQPDLLLLDEPTNHLDIESIQWLENFILTKAKAVVLVSHDKAFLDNVTKRTIEISNGKIYDYKVSYSPFIELRKERVAQQIRAYENQQKEIAEIKDFIERFRYKATKAVQVQSRIKQLEKIVPIEIDDIDKSHISLRFPPAQRSGDFPLILDSIAKNYGNHIVFSDVNIMIRRGEKVAFVGKNGEGKSTLVKCIMNQIEFSGNLKIGHNVNIGYFAQNQAQLLDESVSVFDTIDKVAVGEIRTKIKDILGAFLFGGELGEKKVSVLSGGEKTRLAMIKLLLEPSNLLILDEPTNHLDMKTKNILKNALKDFNGTAIIVSHDRDFLDGLVDKVFEFSNGKVIEHIGGIYNFLSKKRVIDFKEFEIQKSRPLISSINENEIKSDYRKDLSNEKSSKILYFQQKEREKKIRKIEKEINLLELDIETIEKKIKDLEKKLSEGNSSTDILNDYEAFRQNLEEKMHLWEEATKKFENIKSQNNE